MVIQPLFAMSLIFLLPLASGQPRYPNLTVQQALSIPDVHSDLNFYQCTYRLCDSDEIRRYQIQVMVGGKRITPSSNMWASDRDYGYVEALAVLYGHNCHDIYVRVYNGPANDMMVPIDLQVTVRNQSRPMVMTRSCVLPIPTTTEMQTGTTLMPATTGLQFDSNPIQTLMGSNESLCSTGRLNLHSLLSLTLSIAIFASSLFT